MDFKTALNNYIKKLNCTSKELAIKANLSETVISRYRNGLRTPGVNKDEIKNLSIKIIYFTLSSKVIYPIFTSFSIKSSIILVA